MAIARALSNEPLLILADGPTGNLDSKSSNAVIEAFLFAKKQLGATVLMVTYDAIAASHADRVIALSDGMVVRELVRQKEQGQLQMGEIGVFLSLGLSPKSVGKIQNQQLDITFLIGGAAGLVLAVPFSFGIWSLLSLFI